MAMLGKGRGRGALSGFVAGTTALLSRGIEQRDAEAKERRAFDQRLVEAGIRNGQLQVDYSSGQPQVRPAPQGQAGQLGGLDMSNLPPGVRISHVIPGPGGQRTTITMGGQTKKEPAPRAMGESEASRLTMGATPGQPFPIAPRPNIVPLNSPTGQNPDRIVESL